MVLAPSLMNAYLLNSFQPNGTEGSDAVTAIDAVETYFHCITSCSLDDGECVTRCVEELRESP